MKQLDPAVPREALHTRQISCTAYRREDGLWDVEGRISDVRTWSQPGLFAAHPRNGGEALHLMSLRITLDDELLIVAAQAVTHQGPYDDCPQINASYQRLVGLRVGAGFTRAVRERLGGVQGCTHITDLIGPVATTAMQSVPAYQQRAMRLRGEPLPPARDELRNSCHAMREGSQAWRARWG